MAEVQIERKEGGVPWWAWLLLILAIGFTLWWMTAGRERDTDTATSVPAATDTPATNATAADTEVGTLIPVLLIRTTPTDYIGKPVSGTATVAEVVSDRGFWLRGEDGTERIFAVLDDSIPETSPDVNAGQTVRIQGTAHSPDQLDQMPVKQLAADARQSLQNEPAFIHVKSIQILDRLGGADEAAGAAGATGGAADGADLGAIVANPASYFGQNVSATAKVIEADSDRGFWIDAGGQRLFAILARNLDTPDPKTDINTGQTLRFTATVYDASRASDVPELKAVTAETRNLLAGVKAFLRVTDVKIVSR